MQGLYPAREAQLDGHDAHSGNVGYDQPEGRHCGVDGMAHVVYEADELQDDDDNRMIVRPVASLQVSGR